MYAVLVLRFFIPESRSKNFIYTHTCTVCYKVPWVIKVQLLSLWYSINKKKKNVRSACLFFFTPERPRTVCQCKVECPQNIHLDADRVPAPKEKYKRNCVGCSCLACCYLLIYFFFFHSLTDECTMLTPVFSAGNKEAGTLIPATNASASAWVIVLTAH